MCEKYLKTKIMKKETLHKKLRIIFGALIVILNNQTSVRKYKLKESLLFGIPQFLLGKMVGLSSQTIEVMS